MYIYIYMCVYKYCALHRILLAVGALNGDVAVVPCCVHAAVLRPAADSLSMQCRLHKRGNGGVHHVSLRNVQGHRRARTVLAMPHRQCVRPWQHTREQLPVQARVHWSRRRCTTVVLGHYWPYSEPMECPNFLLAIRKYRMVGHKLLIFRNM